MKKKLMHDYDVSIPEWRKNLEYQSALQKSIIIV